MIRYIAKRLMLGLLVVITIVVMITSIIFLAPVDPAQLTFGQRAETGAVAAKRESLGLDKSLPVQMWYYLRDISPINFMKTGDIDQKRYHYIDVITIGSRSLILKQPYLRESYQTGRSVSAILKEAIPKTILLALASILLASLIGIFLGALSAIYKNSITDHIAVICSVIGYSLPSYVTAIILTLIFGYYLGEWTGLNLQGSIIELDDFGDKKVVLKNLILPAIALGIRPVAIITLLTRSSMLDVLQMDYIRTAKAKGLHKYALMIKHALRNALNPVVTAISGWFAALLAGAFFVENVFNFKGLGEVTVTALINFDIPIVLGSVIFTAVTFVLINVMVDILYVYLDPRASID
jgi:peptide/nickel transport system permease protein